MNSFTPLTEAVDRWTAPFAPIASAWQKFGEAATTPQGIAISVVVALLICRFNTQSWVRSLQAVGLFAAVFYGYSALGHVASQVSVLLAPIVFAALMQAVYTGSRRSASFEWMWTHLDAPSKRQFFMGTALVTGGLTLTFLASNLTLYLLPEDPLYPGFEPTLVNWAVAIAGVAAIITGFVVAIRGVMMGAYGYYAILKALIAKESPAQNTI